MTEQLFQDRQKELQSLLKQTDLQAVGLNPGPDMMYLTGLDFHLMERPLVIVVPAKGEPAAIVPNLEMASFEPIKWFSPLRRPLLQPMFYF